MELQQLAGYQSAVNSTPQAKTLCNTCPVSNLVITATGNPANGALGCNPSSGAIEAVLGDRESSLQI
jgi:hypothetical protein